MISTEFFITSLIVVLAPGPGVIYTVSTGLFQGWRSSLAAACGCTAGIVPHLLVSILGLSFILHMSALIFQLMKLAGVAYLLYLAWAMWRDTEKISFTSTSSQDGPWHIASKAVLINLLNPKLTIFFFAFLPLFIATDRGSSTADMVLLSLVFMLITLIVFMLYGVLASAVRAYILHSPKAVLWLRRVFAASFAALGLKLALTQQD